MKSTKEKKKKCKKRNPCPIFLNNQNTPFERLCASAISILTLSFECMTCVEKAEMKRSLVDETTLENESQMQQRVEKMLRA